MAAAEDWQIGASNMNGCFIQLSAGVKWVLSPPMLDCLPRSRRTLQAHEPA